MAGQMLAARDGHIMDVFQLTKPQGWRPDPVRQAATAKKTFTPHSPQSWLDQIGISFTILDEITAFCLKLLEADLSSYMSESNATLVQDMNGPETIAGVIEVGTRAFPDCSLHAQPDKDLPLPSKFASTSLRYLMCRASKNL